MFFIFTSFLFLHSRLVLLLVVSVDFHFHRVVLRLSLHFILSLRLFDFLPVFFRSYSPCFSHSVLVFSIRCVEPSKTKTILQTPDSPVFIVLFTLAKRHLIQSDSFKVQFLHLFCLRIDEFISFFKKRHRKLVKPFISVFKKTCLCVLDFHIDLVSI